MPLLKKFTNYIIDKNLFQKKDRLIVAVSGGVDSVVLCELCYQAGFHFEMAHCNFQLRGQESQRDEQFVQSLGEKYKTKVFVKKFDTEQYVRENKVSIQVAARELRYEWFSELMTNDKNAELKSQNSKIKSQHLTYLLTAHHANDNIETLLINFFKGTGIKGLRGILPKQQHLIRPLLFATRKEIESFAKENNLQFVEDSSNLTDKYTRNYFRHQVIPLVEKVFPHTEANLLDNVERFNDIDVLYRQAMNVHKKKLMEFYKNEVHIPVLKLLKSKPLTTIVFEIVKDYGFTPAQTQEVIHLLKSESGKYISSSTHKIIKNRNWIIILPINTTEANTILIEETDEKIQFEKGTLEIKKINNDNIPIPSSNSTTVLDSKEIVFPLLLRKWKQGDYFYPLGMNKKKKLSRFFIDQKLSVADKENIWVIESNKKILWIIGHRIDDRFKITERTKQVIKISFREL